MKVRKIPIIIEAEQYYPGLEDGFVIRYRDTECPNSTWGIPGSADELPVEIPYITGVAGQKQLLSTGDWILTHPNKKRSVVKNKKFHKLYEKVI